MESEAFLTSHAGGAEHRPPGSCLAGGARRHVAYAEGARFGVAPSKKDQTVTRRAGCFILGLKSNTVSGKIVGREACNGLVKN